MITNLLFGAYGAMVGSFLAASQLIVQFTPASSLDAGDTITVTLPAGTSLAAHEINTSDFEVFQDAPNQSGGCKAGKATSPTALSLDTLRPSITLTIASQSLSKGCGNANGLGQVTLQLSAVASGTELQFPTKATTTASVAITTSKGDSGQLNTVSFVPGPAKQLAFAQEPSEEAVIGSVLSQNPEVTVVDQYGNVVESFSGTVDLEPVEADTPSKTAPGKLAADRIPVSFSKGRAKFSKLSYDSQGKISFRAFGSGLQDAHSRAVSVKPPTTGSAERPQSSGTTAEPTAQAATTQSQTAIARGESTQGVESTPPLSAQPTIAEVKIRLIDQAGRPIAGALVTIFSTPVSAVTDEQGIATFRNVEPGEHRLVVEAAGVRSEQTLNLAAAPQTKTKVVTVTIASPEPSSYQARSQQSRVPEDKRASQMQNLLITLVAIGFAVALPIVVAKNKQ